MCWLSCCSLSGIEEINRSSDSAATLLLLGCAGSFNQAYVTINEVRDVATEQSFILVQRHLACSGRAQRMRAANTNSSSPCKPSKSWRVWRIVCINLCSIATPDRLYLTQHVHVLDTHSCKHVSINDQGLLANLLQQVRHTEVRKEGLRQVKVSSASGASCCTGYPFRHVDDGTAVLSACQRRHRASEKWEETLGQSPRVRSATHVTS
jgi:hypothetical protein